MCNQQSATNLYLLLETLKPKKRIYNVRQSFPTMYVKKNCSLEKACHNFNYSHTPFYGHPIYTDISLLGTVCFVPGERKPLQFL